MLYQPFPSPVPPWSPTATPFQGLTCPMSKSLSLVMCTVLSQAPPPAWPPKSLSLATPHLTSCFILCSTLEGGGQWLRLTD